MNLCVLAKVYMRPNSMGGVRVPVTGAIALVAIEYFSSCFGAGLAIEYIVVHKSIPSQDPRAAARGAFLTRGVF